MKRHKHRQPLSPGDKVTLVNNLEEKVGNGVVVGRTPNRRIIVQPLPNGAPIIVVRSDIRKFPNGGK